MILSHPFNLFFISREENDDSVPLSAKTKRKILDGSQTQSKSKKKGKSS